MNEYMAIYWAAACLVLWAGGGAYVSGGTLMQAIDLVCDDARLSIPQEALLKRLVNNMIKEEKNGTNG